jgi:hypothetical protein
VAQHGLLIICRASDTRCIDRFKSGGNGGARAEHAYLFTLLAPANADTLWD